MADYIIQISEEGHSYTEGDAHLIYSSQYPTLKIFANGSWSATAASTSEPGVFTIHHNLGYKAMYFVFGQTMSFGDADPSSFYESYPRHNYVGLQVYNNFNTTMGTDTLTITVDINGAEASLPATFTGFYIIYYEPLV